MGGIADAVTAYWNWQKNRSGIRSRVSVGFSHFICEGRDTDRYRTTTGVFGICGRGHVKLRRIGWVRTHENTCRLHRPVGLGRARILNVTVRCRGRRLLAVFTVELVRTVPRLLRSVVGVDAGVRRLAAFADRSGRIIERVANHRALNRLRRLPRARRNARRVLSVTDEGRRPYPF